MRPFATLVLALAALGGSPVAAHPPVAGGATIFADGVPGPEGLAFAPDRTLVVGTTTGEVRRYAADGTFTTVAQLGEALAGVTVLRDGRLLVSATTAGKIVEIVDGAPVDVANFGEPLGSGTTVVRVEYNHPGARRSR